MGYELHITRAKSWAMNAKKPIAAGEWLAYVAHDLGKVKVRYDDGREVSFALAASGLSRVEKAGKKG